MEKHRVLVVEDDALLARTISELLREELACSAVLAHDGDAALHALQTDQFDLVLLDIALPGLDGLALYQRVQDQLARLGTPVLFVTGAVPWPTLARQHVAHYLRKPFDFGELVTQAATLLGLPVP